MDVEREIEKLRFHVRKLADAIDYKEHPIEHLVVSLDWTEEDLDKAFDVFEKHDHQLDENGRFDGSGFEMELKETFEIHYQTVKSIILAFWRNGNFRDVCHAYAKHYQVSEFSEILNPELDDE